MKLTAGYHFSFDLFTILEVYRFLNRNPQNFSRRRQIFTCWGRNKLFASNTPKIYYFLHKKSRKRTFCQTKGGWGVKSYVYCFFKNLSIYTFLPT
jgi:hypothetical protein